MKERMGDFFDEHAQTQTPQSEARIDVRVAIKQLQAGVAAHVAKEQKLLATVKKAMQRVRTLQKAYVEQTARKDKEYEIAERAAAEKAAEKKGAGRMGAGGSAWMSPATPSGP